MLRLDYKNRALRYMSHEIETMGSNVPDETLYTMLRLASFGSNEKLRPLSYREVDSILAVAHDLDFYSWLPCEWAHQRALMQIIKQRGGLPAVKRPGFAVVISL